MFGTMNDVDRRDLLGYSKDGMVSGMDFEIYCARNILTTL